MIISRTPVRITIGGGGTDLASYYSKFRGFLISAAIDKYIYTAVNKRFEESIRVSYSKTEIVDDISSVQHPIVRETLKLLNIYKGMEIVSMADIPANTGLGTSSSFTVGLLNALHTYKRENVPKLTLAEEACDIEINRLGEPIGKQDQYIATFGGLTCLDIDETGKVNVYPLKASTHVIAELESNILLFYTGINRNTASVLVHQKRACENNESKVIERLHRIKEIGKETKAALERGDVHRFGELLNEHWVTKKELACNISTSMIDHWYNLALKCGVIGGKIMGAGKGGFFLFYCENGKDQLRKEMEKQGLPETRFRFDFEGSKIIFNS